MANSDQGVPSVRLRVRGSPGPAGKLPAHDLGTEAGGRSDRAGGEQQGVQEKTGSRRSRGLGHLNSETYQIDIS